MARVISKESGHDGELISLGGVRQRDGRGRQILSDYITSVGGNIVQCLEANPKRISALFQNRGTDVILFALGEQSGGGTAILLDPHGTLQIDKDFPWAGAVFVTSPTNVDFSMLEISIQ